MTPGPKCSICTHPHRDQIETAMIERRADVKTGKQFGASVDALRNHRQRCIPIILKRARLADDIRRAEWIYRETERLYRAAVEVIETAENSRDVDLAALMADITPDQRQKVTEAASIISATRSDVLKAVRTARPVIEMVGRLQGQIADTLTINIHQSPDFVELRNCILDALEPYHEARLAVGEAMLKFVEARDLEPAENARAVH